MSDQITASKVSGVPNTLSTDEKYQTYSIETDDHQQGGDVHENIVIIDHS